MPKGTLDTVTASQTSSSTAVTAVDVTSANMPEVPIDAEVHEPHFVVVESRFEEFLVRLWSRRWLAPLAILGCMAAAATWVLSNNPVDDRADPLGPCVFKAFTGLDCPGCGGTRMVWYLLHGDLLQAARFHLMALIAVPVLLYAYLALVADRVGKFRLPSVNIPGGIIAGYALGWVLFVVARNLPWAPFTSFYV